MKLPLNRVCLAAGVAAIFCATSVAWAAPETPSAAEKPTTTAPSASESSLPQVRTINEHMRQGWADNQISPSPYAADSEWCRRVYLDILGRIPSVPELTAFGADKATDRKAKLVQKLLNDESYSEEYARTWMNIWTNVLIGRAGGTENNTMISREGMQKYLRDSFFRNKPYDKMVYELITAKGTNVPGDEKFNGAVNFTVGKLEEKGAQATAKTAQVFLGLQVQCTQCHNHPFNDWKQQKFWEFNAFYRQTTALRKGEKMVGNRTLRVVELANQDYAGEGNNAQEADLYYELRNGLLKVAYPVFVDGTELKKSGYLSECDRRTELGNLVVNSDFMPKAIVNRMWQHFMGYGFTKPIDDMGPHNPPTHPELLDYLGVEFRKHSCDLKQLISWIVLSEPYQLSSKYSGKNAKDDPLVGERPKFSRFYMRQMSAEQLYESLLIATAAGNKGSAEEQEKTKQEWLRQFVVAFGNDEGTESTTFNGTIPQALMMFNGELIKQATSMDNGSFLANVANSNMSPGEKINFLFISGLARKPNSGEISAANFLLTQHKNDTRAALADVWWAVLNSNEFILQH